MVTLEIIDPRNVEKRTDIINELRAFGIDHTSAALISGWNYVLDHVWLADRIDNVIRKGTIILDVGCGASPFHNFIEEKYNVNVIGIDRPTGYSHQAKHENVDIEGDFLDVKIKPHTVSLILWMSSIEHNEVETIKKLWKKSEYLLVPGGVILATIAIAKDTAWFPPSEQTNLSVEDAVEIFGVDEVSGNYESVRAGYTSNILHLNTKMMERYKRDPEFVIAGIEQRPDTHDEFIRRLV